MNANIWAKAFRSDPEPEPARWHNSHCLDGEKRGKACGADLLTAPVKQPDRGRWVYFLPSCGHRVARSRRWLEGLLSRT